MKTSKAYHSYARRFEDEVQELEIVHPYETGDMDSHRFDYF